MSLFAQKIIGKLITFFIFSGLVQSDTYTILEELLYYNKDNKNNHESALRFTHPWTTHHQSILMHQWHLSSWLAWSQENQQYLTVSHRSHPWELCCHSKLLTTTLQLDAILGGCCQPETFGYFFYWLPFQTWILERFICKTMLTSPIIRINR